MNWLDLGKEIIKYGAPLLGFAVGGPAGASIASEVANLFGANPNDPKDVLNKMQSDPDVKVKLSQIEANKSIELQQIAFNKMKTEIDHEDHENDNEEKDVEDARKMIEETHDKMPDILTVIICIALLMLTGIFIFVPIPAQNNNLVCVLLVAFLYEFFNACRFHLGGKIPTLKDLQNLKGK